MNTFFRYIVILQFWLVENDALERFKKIKKIALYFELFFCLAFFWAAFFKTVPLI